MVNLIRKYQQQLLIVFTIAIMIAFAAYWNGPVGMRNGGGARSVPDDAGKLYGKMVTITQLNREARKVEPASLLQLNDLLEGLAGRGRNKEEWITNFAWNCLVLRHEADRLQLQPTDEELKTAIMNIAGFQTNGAFDSEKYSAYVANVLPRYGFGAADLEEMIMDNLRMDKIKALLKTTFTIPAGDFRAWYTLKYQKSVVSVIHFNVSDLAAKIEVSEDDIKKAFEQYMERFQSPEQRGLKFVTFALSDDDKKLTGKDRIAALKTLADEADKFTQDVLDKGAKFDDVAAKYKAPVTEVPPFAASAPDAKVKDVPGLIAAAFTATKDVPNSDVVKGENGYYVAQLQQIVPSRQLTLVEARQQIIDQVKNARAQEKLGVEAREMRNRITVAMAEGKSFQDAVKAAGLTLETYPAFSLTEPNYDKPDGQIVLMKSLDMKEGDLSDLAQTEDGGILIHLDKREPITDDKFEKDRKFMEPRFAKQQLDQVFIEWMQKQREAAGVPAYQPAKSSGIASQ